ncbi:segregation/condensation protein A [Salimicrobium halophilum]|uniref:Segregation and condensation protein A n=1 Tax=Salimicrobium halophilum TaxID=86666 RepID=A0A1G8PXW2_9BACI|nr:segregation/condensation protein A [Salimicrobium halophilum]SDI97311.1 condensin subunit ScpA [Salimicrobium halophilum]
MMENKYHIKVDGFEGPMDLLLHLIQRLEIDIHDIPVAEITDQYMNYIHRMAELELDVASEYLVMAATLLAIKSKVLLPNQSLEPEETEVEEDPREELVERLKEYQKYKSAAQTLREKETEDNEVYTRDPMEVGGETLEQEATVFDMVDALYRMFNKTPPSPEKDRETSVKREEMPIQLTMDRIMKEMDARTDGVPFEQLISVRSRTETVTTFLAMLELIKNHRITCVQNNHFEGLYVYKWEDNDER